MQIKCIQFRDSVIIWLESFRNFFGWYFALKAAYILFSLSIATFTLDTVDQMIMTKLHLQKKKREKYVFGLSI